MFKMSSDNTPTTSSDKFKEKKNGYKFGGRSCCVVGCTMTYKKARDLKLNISFFKVIRKELDLTLLWTKAINNRKNKDGTPWTPKQNTVICGLHFVSGKPNISPDHPDYVPSKFGSEKNSKKGQLCLPLPDPSKGVHPKLSKMINKYTCRECGYFEQSYLFHKLREHYHKIHGNLIKGSVVCALCKEVFYKFSDYHSHCKKVHEGAELPNLNVDDKNPPSQSDKNEIPDFAQSDIKIEKFTEIHENNPERCCVEGCSSYVGSEMDVDFFNAKRSNSEQNELWAKAINGKNSDGSLWYPKKSDLICSSHFVNGFPSKDITNPDYVPSKFPKKYSYNKQLEHEFLMSDPLELGNEFKMEFIEENEDENIALQTSDFSPWAVCNLKEFLMYVCPGCEFKSKEELEFYSHAMQFHPEAQNYLKMDPLVSFDENNTLTNKDDNILDSETPIENSSNETNDAQNEESEDCRLCSKILNTKSEFYEHYKNIHKLTEEEIKDRLFDIDLTSSSEPCTEKLNFEIISDDFGALNDRYQPMECCEETENCTVFEYSSVCAIHTIENHMSSDESNFDKPLPMYSVCSLCKNLPTVFYDRSEFDRHILMRHAFDLFLTNGCILVCSLCGQEVIDSSDHIDSLCTRSNRPRRLDPNDRTCTICSVIFPNIAEVYQHYKTEHPEETCPIHVDNVLVCECKNCHKISPSYKEHIEHERKCRHTCLECGYYTLDYTKLRTHYYNKHGKTTKGTLICDICAKVYHSKTDFENHKKYVHEGVKKQRKMCQHCGKSFLPEHLSEHINLRHQDVSVRTCGICQEIFPNVAEVYKHYQTEHPEESCPIKVDNVLVCECKICHKILASNAAMYTHYKLTHKMSKESMKKSGFSFKRTKQHLKIKGTQILEKDRMKCP